MTKGLATRPSLFYSVADQGVSALTNIAVVVIVARMSSAADFAAFAIAYLVFTIVLGLFGAYVGQSLVLERDTDGQARIRGACRSGVAFTLLAATLIGAGLVSAMLPLSGVTAGALAALGVVFPIVLTQDAFRYCCSTLRLPHYALLADLVRLAAVLPALAIQPAGASPGRMVLAWGLSATPALAVSAILLAPKLRGAGTDIRRYFRRGYLGRRFAVEFGVGNAGSQLSVLGLGLFANQLAVGALRGVVALFGPLNVLYTAATAFGPPLLRDRGIAGTVRTTALAGTALAAVAGAWAAALSLLPDQWGREVLGDTWAGAASLVPAIGSQYVAMAMGVTGLLTLRVLRPHSTMPIQLVFSVATVLFFFTGYLHAGVIGAAWGLCLGSVLKALAVWIRVVFVRCDLLRDPGVLSPVGAGAASSPR